MRAVIKLLFLCLIVASVGLGGLRQATAASWSGIGGETLVSPSPRCDSTSPDHPHAPIHLCLLKHCCVLSSSSGDAFSMQKAIVAYWCAFEPPVGDTGPRGVLETRACRLTSTGRNALASTGPPVRF
jgi:hypothetical protein